MKKLFALAAIGALVFPFMTGCSDDADVSAACSGGTCTCAGSGKICVGTTWVDCKDSQVQKQVADSPKCK